ncbi:glucosaminidase domain-containing protein [Marinobacter sp. X15-166B]|uniref:glucosaminidase domain-containing protein n=1 Tax=Marinobacter sp. X15-166B TaxID=1897620 RepID=UPI000B203E33|nr:glucosaminidase domain-containing protein [Marinobacter sp. X15-166B]
MPTPRKKKAAFFSFLYPRIVLANSRILLEREYLLTLQNKAGLTAAEQAWLSAQAQRLRVDAALASDAMFTALGRRLDTMPPSLVLAQAANESAWGTSRFARDGNNLFGQWCFSKGCGLVPTGRVAGALHEVARFRSPYESVRAYIQNLNRHTSYQHLRELRARHRDEERLADGVTLAAGLMNYSERGQPYIDEIRSMIRFNNLSFYDQQFARSVAGVQPQTLTRLVTAARSADLLPRVESADAPASEG